MKFTVILILLSITLFAQGEGWKAGAASRIITPDEPVWMAGYGGRKEPATGKRTDLFAKALLLEDAGGQTGLILTLDLVGIDQGFANRVTEAIAKKHALTREQIAICTSHTHSGPVVAQNLSPLHYLSLGEDEQQKIDAYAEVLLKHITEVTDAAFASKAPARLQHGSGKCTFAVNRRENKPYETVPEKRSSGLLKGPVDHDVPVLTVRGEDDNLLAILFGYACHATTLSLNEWNADYPGYAQTALEAAFPGSVALFWAGCGGDQNPLPRKEIPLAEDYGADLAARVVDVINAPMAELSPKLSTHFLLIDAPLKAIPDADSIEKSKTSTNRFEVARANYLQRKMAKEGPLKKSYPFPIGHWVMGGQIDFIFLGGEVVIDYALRLKQERRGTRTWVAAYANDVMAYIPSLRVLKEGGYEGGGSNVYYGLPSLWDETIEEVIISAVPDPPTP
ncbi:neutral/alkaline non-lysosomal ceramidase N-terminal domain-containing protein [Verrucomicrobiales bacterium BCK34]|nr:neutral/alkaline non-lysosomal ceramidase N-terminal domain-containing protein [Verrucomicrobiales bacterium BCK34]